MKFKVIPQNWVKLIISCVLTAPKQAKTGNTFKINMRNLLRYTVIYGDVCSYLEKYIVCMCECHRYRFTEYVCCQLTEGKKELSWSVSS